MERSEVSEHEVQVYLTLKNEAGWMTNTEIAEITQDVSPRTVRLHTKRLTELGILDVAEVFPAHRFRVAEKASKRNAAYVRRLEKAVEIFGLGEEA